MTLAKCKTALTSIRYNLSLAHILKTFTAKNLNGESWDPASTSLFVHSTPDARANHWENLHKGLAVCQHTEGIKPIFNIYLK